MGWSSVLSKWAPFTTVLQSQNCPLNVWSPHEVTFFYRVPCPFMTTMHWCCANQRSEDESTGVGYYAVFRAPASEIIILQLYSPAHSSLASSTPLSTTPLSFCRLTNPHHFTLFNIFLFLFCFILSSSVYQNKTKKLVVNLFCFVINF